MPNLTTLVPVREYLDVKDNSKDSLLKRLIAASSGAIHQYLNRTNLLPASYSEAVAGNGTNMMATKHYPIISVSSLFIENKEILPSPDKLQYGYYFTDIAVFLAQSSAVRMVYERGTMVRLEYRAGFQKTETLVVPNDNEYQIIPESVGRAFLDLGVTYEGAALTGYTFVDGVYTFPSTDASKAVSITYGYVPFDVEHVCIEMIAKRWVDIKRIGKSSEGIAGQSITYDVTAMTEYQKLALSPYRRVIPL